MQSGVNVECSTCVPPPTAAAAKSTSEEKKRQRLLSLFITFNCFKDSFSRYSVVVAFCLLPLLLIETSHQSSDRAQFHCEVEAAHRGCDYADDANDECGHHHRVLMMSC